jgi:hypothetical protein
VFGHLANDPTGRARQLSKVGKLELIEEVVKAA